MSDPIDQQGAAPSQDEMSVEKLTLEGLEARIRDLRKREDQETRRGPEQGRKQVSGLGMAMRVGIELVAAIVVGTGIGYGLDRALGTKPWVMIVFLLLGGAAGVMNVYRLMQGMDETPGLERARRSRDRRSSDS